MRSSAQNGPEWIYNKKIEPKSTVLLDRTLTKQFYGSNSNRRSVSQYNTPLNDVNSDINISNRLFNDFQKDKLSQPICSGIFEYKKPIKTEYQLLLEDLKQNQIHQEMELLNREHDRLRRLIAQRFVYKNRRNSLLVSKYRNKTY